MDANQVFLIIQYAAAKNQNGYISPDDFNNVLMPVGQREYLDYLLGEYEKYQAGRPIAAVELGNNKRVRQSVTPFIYSRILNPNTITGIADYPSDFEIADAMWTVYNFKKVRFIQQNQLDSAYNSKIDPIATNPIYLIKYEGFQFYPENIITAKLSYVRTPPSIIWGYDEIDGEAVYNASKSQQPIWRDTDIMEVIVRALRLVGVNLQLGQVQQYAEEVKNIGQ